MSTLSQLVDDVVTVTSRGNLIPRITGWVNQTIRECQSLSYFSSDMVEDQLTVTSVPFTWERPAAPLQALRLLRTVNYNGTVYPAYKPPGRIQLNENNLFPGRYYYAAGNYYAFSGVGLNDTVNVAYYIWNKRLLYYALTPEGTRPTYYDFDAEKWQYWSGSAYVDTLGSAILDEAARFKVSNWLTDRYYDTVFEGTLAKLYKAMADKDRSSQSFALYKTLQKDITANEAHETLDR